MPSSGSFLLGRSIGIRLHPCRNHVDAAGSHAVAMLAGRSTCSHVQYCIRREQTISHPVCAWDGKHGCQKYTTPRHSLGRGKTTQADVFAGTRLQIAERHLRACMQKPSTSSLAAESKTLFASRLGGVHIAMHENLCKSTIS